MVGAIYCAPYNTDMYNLFKYLPAGETSFAFLIVSSNTFFGIFALEAELLELSFDCQCFRESDLCARLNARVALDAIGGTMTARLLAALPRNGRVILYGALAEEASVLNPAEVIFADKVLEGFYVPNWLAKKSLPQMILIQRRVMRLLGSDLTTAIRARARLDEAGPAIADYAKSMTGGKLLILPNVAPA